MKLLLAYLTVLPSLVVAQLPNTELLAPRADFSADMVAGIDRYLLREIDTAKGKRASRWQRDTTSPEAYAKSIAQNREHLREAIGAIDTRVPCTALEFVGDTDNPSLLAETARVTVHRVRWPVLTGVFGEGILIQPRGKILGRIIYLPDADKTPETLIGLTIGEVDFMLAGSGMQIILPTLISRSSDFSSSERYGIKTNVPHREWVYRQSYEFGRHIIGYEVQKALALLDYFALQPEKVPVTIAGVGEGALIALYAGALDTRIASVYCCGYFGPREKVWEEPLYRNVFGLLREFGDAEIASMIAPRHLAVHHFSYPNSKGPPEAKKGERAIAAPGLLHPQKVDAAKAELERAKALAGDHVGDWAHFFVMESEIKDIVAHLVDAPTAQTVMVAVNEGRGAPAAKVIAPVKTIPAFLFQARQQRLVRELCDYSQSLIVKSEMERDAAFWKPLPLGSIAAFEKATAAHRERFQNEVIGKLPDPNVPMNPLSRLVRETDKVSIYEVTLDVWDGVFAWGWLCLPKDIKKGEHRPVVVCQHGLEGIPEDTITDDKNGGWKFYKAFALKLAEQGFVTFAPHNPYRGHDAFRGLQRKLNPLGLTLYSVINGQHQRLLEWLGAQSFVDAKRIAFYGLSYGGKSAMRTPALLPGYCLSICSGDFNEWVRKCASDAMPMTYLFTGEYEIWEWRMGTTYNYAEMAAMIAPRPFMVERGHNDGVGTDEWVSYEFAKVRRLYNKLGIGNDARIEYFDGPHTINGQGTFEFLHEKLKWPVK